MTCAYAPGAGMLVNYRIDGQTGFTFVLPEWWSVAAVERYLSELEAVYGAPLPSQPPS